MGLSPVPAPVFHSFFHLFFLSSHSAGQEASVTSLYPGAADVQVLNPTHHPTTTIRVLSGRLAQTHGILSHLLSNDVWILLFFCQPAWLSCACSWPASFHLPTSILGAGSHLNKGTLVIVSLHHCSLAPLQQGWIQHGWDVIWRVFLW